MLVTRSKFSDVWNLLRKHCLRNSQPVLVFVTSTVDALCSCKILTELLKCDFISFQLYPVFSYAHLKQLFLEIEENGTYWEFSLFIELGATVDLLQLLQWKESEMSKYLLVWDTQRPYHLRNLDSKYVFLFDRHSQESWAKQVKTLPFVGLENEYGLVLQSSSLEETTLYEENETDVTDEEVVASVEWDNESCASPLWDRLEDISNGFFGEQISSTNSNRITEHSLMDSEDYDRSLERTREALQYYAKPEWDACSSSILTYVLARDMNQGTISHLWLAILGLTDHFLDNRIWKGDYEMQISFLKAELERYQSTTTNTEDSSPIGMLSTSCSWDKENERSDYGDKSRVIYSIEWKIELMRLWTFYDSLMHSCLFVSRLATWKQKGQRDILEMLAILGIPLKDAKQTWNHMDVRCKRLLQSKFSVACRHFGLDDISFPSFIRVFADGSCFSAMDMVLSIRALFLGNGRECLQRAIYIRRYLVEEVAQVADRQRILSCKHFRYILWKECSVNMKCLLLSPLYRSFSVMIGETIQQRNIFSSKKPLLFLAKVSSDVWQVWWLTLVTHSTVSPFFLHLQQTILELLPHVRIEQGRLVYYVENGYEKTLLRKLQFL
ncbi:Cell division control protein 45 [Galdieria sulphuraria]|nr:Cell division control protein 45 [Galdieria sulphuraria]